MHSLFIEICHHLAHGDDYDVEVASVAFSMMGRSIHTLELVIATDGLSDGIFGFRLGWTAWLGKG